jgi:hypothetical protein
VRTVRLAQVFIKNEKSFFHFRFRFPKSVSHGDSHVKIKGCLFGEKKKTREAKKTHSQAKTKGNEDVRIISTTLGIKMINAMTVKSNHVVSRDARKETNGLSEKITSRVAPSPH